MKSQSGQSLVGVMVGSAIMAVVIAAFTTMVSNQQRATRQLSEKLALISVKSLVLSTLSTSSICLRQGPGNSTQTFNANLVGTATPPSLTGPPVTLYNGTSATAPAFMANGTAPIGDNPQVQVSNINITGISGAGTEFQGNLQITFDATRLVMPLAPVTVPVSFKADVTNPAAAAVSSCLTAATPGSTGGPLATALGAPDFFTNYFVCNFADRTGRAGDLQRCLLTFTRYSPVYGNVRYTSGNTGGVLTCPAFVVFDLNGRLVEIDDSNYSYLNGDCIPNTVNIKTVGSARAFN